MARLPQPGSDDGQWGEILNEYLSESHDADGSIKPGAVTKADVGLSSVDNTSDASKPVSAATQAALDQKVATSQLDALTASRIQDDGSLTAGALADVFVSPQARSLKRLRRSVFVIFGESNSGGLGFNSDLTTAEVAPRPSVQIWNNNTSVFETLDIGTNNNLGHFNLTGVVAAPDVAPNTQDKTRHGWEAAIADSAERGDWGLDPVYLVKCGQGGSTVEQWAVGHTSGFWASMVARVTGAITTLREADYEVDVYALCTIGINDHIAGTTPTAYRTGLLDLLERVRTLVRDLCGVPQVPITFTTLPTTAPKSRASYNAVLNTIAASDAYFFLVDTASAPLMSDLNHWTTGGMKRIGEQMITVHRDRVGQGTQYDATVASKRGAAVGSQRRVDDLDNAIRRVPIAWGSRPVGVGDNGDGTVTGSGSQNVGSVAADPLDSATLDYVIDLPSAVAAAGVVVLIDDDFLPSYGWNVANTFISGIYLYNGALFVATAGAGSSGADIPTGLTITDFPARIGARAVNNDLVYSISRDNGATFTDFYTHTDVLTGRTLVYLKTIFATSTAGQSVRVTARATMRTLTRRLSDQVSKLEARLAAIEATVPYRDIVWASMSSGVADLGGGVIARNAATSSVGGISATSLDAENFEILLSLTSSDATNAVVLALETTNDTSYAWNAGQSFAGGGTFQNAGNVFAATSQPNAADTGVDITAYPSTLRMRNTGDDVQIHVSINNGLWTLAHTFPGVLAGVTEIWPKIIFASPTPLQTVRVRARRT